MSQIIAALPHDTFSHAEKHSRVDLEHAIMHLREPFIRTLIDLAVSPTVLDPDESFLVSLRS
jgi:hypothetical protein